MKTTKCRDCIHFKKSWGSKSKNTDFGQCELMSIKTSNDSNNWPEQFSSNTRLKNKQNIAMRKFHHASVQMEGIFISIDSKNIDSSVGAWVDGDFFCAKFKEIDKTDELEKN